MLSLSEYVGYIETNQEDIQMGRLFTGFGIVWLIIVLGMMVGWIGNIADVASGPVDWDNGRDLIGVGGVAIPPLGAILWWFF